MLPLQASFSDINILYALSFHEAFHEMNKYINILTNPFLLLFSATDINSFVPTLISPSWVALNAMD